MKLCPQRMDASTASLPKAQISAIRDLGDGETRPVQPTGNNPSRAATSFSQDEIAECVLLPTRHSFLNYVSGEMFPTRWCIECDPGGKDAQVVSIGSAGA